MSRKCLHPSSEWNVQQDVTLIGGGASGALVVMHLLRSRFEGSIAIVEPNTRLARGVAYATEDNGHTLNVRALGMSALPDDPEDFCRWWSRHDQRADPAGFAPRAVYGQYLEARMYEAIEAQSAWSRVTWIRDEVTAVRYENGQWQSELSGGGRLASAMVLLCCGFPAARPPRELAGLVDHPSVTFDPYAPLRDGRIREGDRVLVLGTGLTMADVVQSIVTSRTLARITAISRRGLVPHAYRAWPSLPITADVGDALDTLIAESASLRRWREYLIPTARSLDADGADPCELVTYLRPHLGRIWSGWSSRERSAFMRHLRPYWEVVRHRMPTPQAAGLQSAIESGRVRIIGGRVLEVLGDDPTVVGVRWRERRFGLESTAEFDHVLVAIGPGIGRERPTGLLRDLIREGHVEPDPWGLGVLCGPDGSTLVRGTCRAPGMYVVGPLRRPNEWEATAIPELRVQAKRLAERLAEDSKRNLPRNI